jgi:hypothetical protein
MRNWPEAALATAACRLAQSNKRRNHRLCLDGAHNVVMQTIRHPPSAGGIWLRDARSSVAASRTHGSPDHYRNVVTGSAEEFAAFGTHRAEHGSPGDIGAVEEDGQQELVFNPAGVAERSLRIVAELHGEEPHAPRARQHGCSTLSHDEFEKAVDACESGAVAVLAEGTGAVVKWTPEMGPGDWLEAEAVLSW